MKIIDFCMQYKFKNKLPNFEFSSTSIKKHLKHVQ